MSALLMFIGCRSAAPPGSDEIQRAQQEQLLQEGTLKVGMPAITHFRERKIMKDILELRDQERYVTYTYTYSEMDGSYRFFCVSMGYPIPYATQFTNPEKRYANTVIRQADPNGLFSPGSAEGTWVMCKDPTSERVGVVYVEPKLTTLPWPMPGVPMSKKEAD